LLTGWKLNISLGSYLIKCALITIAIRIFQCLIKAFQSGLGEHGKEIQTWPYFKRFILAFYGFKHKCLADHWLGALIGFSEISFYPVLIVTDNLGAIGAWLIIKTAGGFKLWENNQRAFNRFLVLNLINLGIAYFVTAKWISAI